MGVPWNFSLRGLAPVATHRRSRRKAMTISADAGDDGEHDASLEPQVDGHSIHAVKFGH
jgi:hypothetical protein